MADILTRGWDDEPQVETRGWDTLPGLDQEQSDALIRADHEGKPFEVTVEDGRMSDNRVTGEPVEPPAKGWEPVSQNSVMANPALAAAEQAYAFGKDQAIEVGQEAAKPAAPPSVKSTDEVIAELAKMPLAERATRIVMGLPVGTIETAVQMAAQIPAMAAQAAGFAKAVSEGKFSPEDFQKATEEITPKWVTDLASAEAVQPETYAGALMSAGLGEAFHQGGRALAAPGAGIVASTKAALAGEGTSGAQQRFREIYAKVAPVTEQLLNAGILGQMAVSGARSALRRPEDPAEAAKPVLQAENLDDAISAAEQAINAPHETEAARAPEPPPLDIPTLTDEVSRPAPEAEVPTLTEEVPPAETPPSTAAPELAPPNERPVEALPAAQEAPQAALPAEAPVAQPAPETPAAARTVQEMTVPELDAILRLTRSESRRAEIAAELVRRHAETQPETGIVVPNEGRPRPVETSNAVQERSAEALPVRNEPEGGAGVRVENAQGQEAPGARQGDHRPAPEAVAPEATNVAPALTKDDALSAVRNAAVAMRGAEPEAMRQHVTALDAASAAAEKAGASRIEILRATQRETAQPAQAVVPEHLRAAEAKPETPAEKPPEFEDYKAPRADNGKGILRGQVRTFKTEKLATAFAKQQRLRGYTARQTEAGWALSKPVRERTAAPRAEEAVVRPELPAAERAPESPPEPPPVEAPREAPKQPAAAVREPTEAEPVAAESKGRTPMLARPLTGPEKYRNVDAIAHEMKPKVGTDKRGVTYYEGNGIGIARGRDPVRVGQGTTRLKYDIFDTTKRNASGKPLKVGSAIVDVDRYGLFKTIRNIEIDKAYRQKGNGYGERAVATMIAHNKGVEIAVHDIQHAGREAEYDALPFWRKMGVQLDNYSSNPDIEMNGRISRDRYLQALSQRGKVWRDGTLTGNDQAEAGARGNEPRAPQSDAGGTGSGGRVLPRAPGSLQEHPQEVTKPQEPPPESGGSSSGPSLRRGHESSGLSETEARAALKDAIEKTRVPIRVLQSVDDLRKIEGFEDSPNDAKGGYYKGRIYVVADNIRDAVDLERTVARHEVTHAGIDAVYGDSHAREVALTKLIAANPKVRETAKAWRDQYGEEFLADAKKRGLSDADAKRELRLTSFEEGIAHFAEGGNTIKGWQQFVATIQKGLRAMGLHRLADWIEGATDAEALSFLDEMRRATQEQPQGEGELAPAFARSRDDVAADAVRWGETVDRFIAGKLPQRDVILATRTPDVIDKLGVPDQPVSIHPNILRKALQPETASQHGHGLAVNVVKGIVRAMHDPVAVFESGSRDGLTILTSLEDLGRPILIGIKPDVEINRNVVTSIRTIHAKDNPGVFASWVRDGRLDYVDQSKRPAWLTTGEGLNSLPVGPTARGVANRILTEADLVKGDRGMLSRRDETPMLSRGGSKRPDWIERGPAALKAAASKIDTYAEGESFQQKLQALKATWKEQLVQGMFDAYAPLKRLGPTEYMKARMVKASDGALEGMLLYGKPEMTDSGVIRGQIDHKGFLGAMQELNGEHDRFFMWAAGNRAERLMGEGREHLFSADEIRAMKGLVRGHMADGRLRANVYAKAATTLRAYNKAVLDIAEKTGLIDGESRHLWEFDYYIPFFRVDEDATISGPSKVKGFVRQQAFKKLKGGTENLGDLMANTLRNWSHLLSASMANQAAVASLKAAERAGIARELTKQEIAGDMVPKGATYAMVNGKKTYYEVSDPFILTAISAMESASFKGLPMKVLGKFKHYLTLGVTVSPTFRVRNLIRDTIAALGQNEISYNVAKNLMRGFEGTRKQGLTYPQMLFSGAMMRFGYLTDGKHAEHAKRLIEAGVDGDTILTSPEKVKAAVGKLWDEWQEFGDRMENVNRAALYQQLKAEGKTDLEAAFAARDMMDFSLQGSWVAVRFLSQIVPFQNARLQGLYKLGRAAVENPRRAGYVMGAVALASATLLLAYQDDPEWKKRPDWDRDTYWWFRIGDTAYRIPKPFEIGAIGTLVERSLELMTSDEMTGKRFADRLRFMLSQTFQMSIMPQALGPLFDLYANQDSFSGRLIESQSMQARTKPERATPNTSAIARLLGKAGDTTGISPVQIDYLLRSYFGWLGSHIAMASDVMTQPFLDSTKPARKIDDYFVIGDFVKALPSNQSRYVDDFYKQAQTIQQVMGDIRQAREAHDAEKVREILRDRKADVALSHLYSNAQRRMATINRRVRQVTASSMDPDEKRAELDRLMTMRNELARVVEQRATERRRSAGE